MDGYDPATGDVYEIHGCIFHGCPKCFKNREGKGPLNKNKTIRELYDLTMRKDADIRAEDPCRDMHNTKSLSLTRL